MKKQIILYIIQTIIPIETIFMLMVAFICQNAKDFSKYWLILLSFQIPIVCMVVFSTIAYYESYLGEAEKWREQLKKMEQEWKSNKEFVDCWNEFKKEKGETMKKYIRTEKGIYEVSEKATYCGKNFYYTTAEVTLEDIDIVKQADTIEELCDELVIKHMTYEKPYIADNYQKSFLLNDKKVFEYGVEIVYGAIWTDKGLIYVAKMNEKGDLVLI